MDSDLGNLYFYARSSFGLYVNKGNGLEFVTPALNQDVLLSYWPIVVIVIGLEIALALYKLIKGQWTRKLAIFNTVYEVIATVVIIVIMINPNLFQLEFTSYMADLFSITIEQFKNRVISGVIFLFVIFGDLMFMMDFVRQEFNNHLIEKSAIVRRFF